MSLRAFSVSLAIAVSLGISSGTRAATVYVSADGFDAPTCGTKDNPCRSISQAIGLPTTSAGDRIVVGPGRYGDLDGDGVPGEAGEETPAPGCGCMLAVNRQVSVTSSHGAAATMIDARTVDVIQNVLIISGGGEFGRPGKGFTVTNTATPSGDGIVIDSSGVTVRGNHLLAFSDVVGGHGLKTVAASQTMRIEGNLVQGWSIGLAAPGAGKTVRKNQVSLNSVGIEAQAGEFTGNIATHNRIGIAVTGTARVVGNAAHGNTEAGFFVATPFTGAFEDNNVFSNGTNNPPPGVPNCGLTHDIADLVVGRNYWGSPAGPGADPADDICTFGSGTTLPVSSFATKRYQVKATIKP